MPAPRKVTGGGWIDFSAVVEALASVGAETVIGWLALPGYREGQEWVAPNPRTGSLGSFRIHLRKGLWCDHSDIGPAGRPIGGNLLSLIARCRDCSPAAAAEWAMTRIGRPREDFLRDAKPTARRRSGGNVAPAPTERLRLAPPEPSAEERLVQHNRALAYWLGHDSDGWRGTAVEAYLRDTRAIDVAALAGDCGALRYGRSVLEPHVREGGRRFEAMLALVVDGDGRALCVHRTYLIRTDDGRVEKAPVGQSGKAVTAGFRGGVIPLTRGQTGLPWSKRGSRAAETGETETLAVAEGIETALSGAVVRPDWRWCAGVCLANLGNLPVDRRIDTLVLVGDHDLSAQAQGSLAAVRKRWAQVHPDVRLALPARGDLNDVLRGL